MEVKTGYKLTEVGIIPEDWSIKTLGELGRFKNGINKSSDSFGYGNPFVNLMDVFNNTYINCIDSLGLVNSTKSEQEMYDLIKGDVLFVRSSVKPGGVGLTSLIDNNLESTVFSGFLIRFRSNAQLCHKYKAYCFSEPNFRERIISSSSVSANTNINQNSLKQLFISYPSSIEEQEKIATILCDVDALIASLEKLIEKKKNIKQGMIQLLLTGKKRLPGFDSGWINNNIGDIINVRKGQTITIKMSQQGDIPVIAGGKTPAYYHNKRNRDCNTITISGSGANAGYVAFHDYPIFASDCSTIEENHNINIKFLYYLLKLKQNELFELQTGGAQPHVYPNDISRMNIFYPSCPAEQKAIADSITDFEKSIRQAVTQRDKYKLIKQGMMQELLTGRIRLI